MAYEKDSEPSILLRLPRDIRVMVYEYLLDMTSCRDIVIHNKPKNHKLKMDQIHRSKYHVQERSFHRPLYQTTYGIKGDKELHPAIMAVNRELRHEVAHYLYGTHSFHFGSDVEAVVPFLRDLTNSTRSIIKEITVHKAAPSKLAHGGDDAAWPSICHFLGTLPRLRKLRIVVEGGRPRDVWEGPMALSVSDMRLLYSTRNECLEWVCRLAGIGSVDEVEIVADMKPMAQPVTSSSLIYAAFSASIETTLVEFLRTDLDIPALNRQC